MVMENGQEVFSAFSIAMAVKEIGRSISVATLFTIVKGYCKRKDVNQRNHPHFSFFPTL